MTSVPDILASNRKDDIDPDLTWRVSERLTRWRTKESGGRLEGFGPEVMEIELDRPGIDALRRALLGLVEPDLTNQVLARAYLASEPSTPGL